jgi:hypothetical protein
MTSSLLPTLLKAQTSPHSSLATRMTLRDCTLFLQVPRELLADPDGSQTPSTDHDVDATPPQSEVSSIANGIEARPIRIVIADLDEKSEAIRGEYWLSLEDSLINGGYYLGEGKLDNNAEDCDLRDIVWTSDQVTWNGTV